ncbi:MAG TPA: YceI family protein [Candidatus Dormibacteraeota bacterium]|nr:YceI family protein [Candidatus Dormibacteraeota bacterium]
MKTFFSHRRNLIGTAVAGVLLLGAVGIGIIYYAVFAGSAPQKLALSSPTPSIAASAASPASSPGVGTWTAGSGSQAGYRVREQLASLPAPSDAVGRTTAITGALSLTRSAGGYSVSAASISVDVSKLTSDKAMRDQRIHQQGLESDRYPTATFQLMSPIALPAGAASGQTIHVSATGALTIHGVNRTVTIPIDARLTGSEIELVGSITFPFSEFGMTPPSIGGFVSVQNNATMEFQLMMTQQGA